MKNNYGYVANYTSTLRLPRPKTEEHKCKSSLAQSTISPFTLREGQTVGLCGDYANVTEREAETVMEWQ
jgi:hypothetical protein